MADSVKYYLYSDNFIPKSLSPAYAYLLSLVYPEFTPENYPLDLLQGAGDRGARAGRRDNLRTNNQYWSGAQIRRHLKE